MTTTAKEITIGQRFIYHPGELNWKLKRIPNTAATNKIHVVNEHGQRFHIDGDAPVKPIYQLPARTAATKKAAA